MKWHYRLLSVLLLMLNCVFAQIAMAWGGLELSFELDGDVYLVNNGDSDVTFDGYTLSCETGCLDPQGWKSIARHVSEGKDREVVAALGAGALGFGEANPTRNSLSELNVSGLGVGKPGLRFFIGRPIGNFGQPNCVTIDANTSSSTGSRHTYCIPEPSALFLAIFGAVMLVVHRIRWNV